MPRLSVNQWKAVLFIAGGVLSALAVFFPDYAAGFEKLAALLGGGAFGVLIAGPGHVSVTTHPDDLP